VNFGSPSSEAKKIIGAPGRRTERSYAFADERVASGALGRAGIRGFALPLRFPDFWRIFFYLRAGTKALRHTARRMVRGDRGKGVQLLKNRCSAPGGPSASRWTASDAGDGRLSGKKIRREFVVANSRNCLNNFRK
jgi:hypothetical protein